MGRVEDGDDLVARARDDADALGRLYERHYDRVFAYCVRRLFVKAVAEDVTSTVFLHVARHICDFAGSREQDFRNWLYTIATNEVNAYVRTTKRRAQLFEAAGRLRVASQPDSPTALDRPDWPLLYQAIVRLRPKHQTVIVLRFFEGLANDEIAGILGCRPATVRVTLKRALDALRRQLLPLAAEASGG